MREEYKESLKNEFSELIKNIENGEKLEKIDFYCFEDKSINDYLYFYDEYCNLKELENSIKMDLENRCQK